MPRMTHAERAATLADCMERCDMIKKLCLVITSRRYVTDDELAEARDVLIKLEKKLRG